MSDTATWQEENTRTLSAAIARVRALLQRRAEGNETLAARTEPDKSDELGTWFRRRQACARAAPPHHVVTEGGTCCRSPLLCRLARNGYRGNARRAARAARPHAV
jgi:hypothetical protein